MKVCHLNRDDGDGGATRAALRLHTGLLQIGQNSVFCVRLQRSKIPGVRPLEFSKGLAARALRAMRRIGVKCSEATWRERPPGYEAFGGARSQFGDELSGVFPDCDLVNLHWVPEVMDFRGFFPAVPNRIPVVWTLHDMSPFTGGCPYDDGCGRFVDECGRCPQLGGASARDVSSRNLCRKSRALADVDPSRLVIVSPSRWLAGAAANSKIMHRFKVQVIPYGLDTEVFCPRDRILSRKLLQLPVNAKIVLFIANSVSNRRKGFAQLLEVMGRLSDLKDICLISVGMNPVDVKLPVMYRHLGSVNVDGILSLVYSSADVFVIPSLQDNLPNTVLEALSCGIPVVGFDVGGIPDVVRPGLTGELVAPDDVGAMAYKIKALLENEPQRLEMGGNCRKVALDEYRLDIQARRYVELYSGLRKNL